MGSQTGLKRAKRPPGQGAIEKTKKAIGPEIKTKLGSQNTGCPPEYCHVLGPLIGKSRWCWTIWGKHPSAGDYLGRGLTTRVEQALSNWIQEGYARLNVKESDARIPCAWRFWTQATGNHAIACGILGNSCDQLGRPYPLLIMGTGKLKGWERHWEYLPAGLEPTWRQMEQLSASRAERFEELERILSGFRPPDPDWSNLKNGKWVMNNPPMDSLLETKRLHVNNIEQTDSVAIKTHQIVPLSGDSIDAAMEWHKEAKAENQRIPSSLFMGGPVEKPYLAVFTRALSPSDFVRLWTL